MRAGAASWAQRFQEGRVLASGLPTAAPAHASGHGDRTQLSPSPALLALSSSTQSHSSSAACLEMPRDCQTPRELGTGTISGDAPQAANSAH